MAECRIRRAALGLRPTECIRDDGHEGDHEDFAGNRWSADETPAQPRGCTSCAATGWEYDRDACTRQVCPMRDAERAAQPDAAPAPDGANTGGAGGSGPFGWTSDEMRRRDLAKIRKRADYVHRAHASDEGDPVTQVAIDVWNLVAEVERLIREVARVERMERMAVRHAADADAKLAAADAESYRRLTDLAEARAARLRHESDCHTEPDTEVTDLRAELTAARAEIERLAGVIADRRAPAFAEEMGRD